MRGLYPRREPLTRLRFAKPPSPKRGEGAEPSRLTTLRRHRNWREIHEPALGLHEALDLRAHRARHDVICDVEKHRVVDGGRVQFGQHLIACGRIEGLARFCHELVEFWIIDVTPII